MVFGRQWADFCSNGGRGSNLSLARTKTNSWLPNGNLRLFGRVATNRTDIAESAQLDLLLAEIDNKFSDLDLLVNSAGVFLPGSVLNLRWWNFKISWDELWSRW